MDSLSLFIIWAKYSMSEIFNKRFISMTCIRPCYYWENLGVPKGSRKKPPPWPLLKKCGFPNHSPFSHLTNFCETKPFLIRGNIFLTLQSNAFINSKRSNYWPHIVVFFAEQNLIRNQFASLLLTVCSCYTVLIQCTN